MVEELSGLRPDASAPLSEEELLELAELLVSDTVPETAMDIETLDGFFCALVIGPEPVPPEEYLPVLWSEDPENTEIEFRSERDANRFFALIAGFWNEVANALNDGEPYEPIIVRDSPGEVTPDTGRGWAMGYLQGAEMRADAWRDLAATEDGAADFELLEQLAGDSLELGERSSLLGELPDMLEGHATFWKEQTRRH
jgi:uncharacterized protein